MPKCLREAVLYAPASTARYLSRTDQARSRGKLRKRGSFLANELYGAANLVFRACLGSETKIAVTVCCRNRSSITL